ncbi:MAG: ABC transporter permease [Spirochaetales bacterium]|nr:ABC transporter permease [Spirochaetales bacterium]
MKLPLLVRQDIKYQFRNGIYLVYGILVVIYIVAISLLPPEGKIYAGIFTIFTDTGVLGFFFVGAVVMFERNEQLFESLFVTPVRIGEYMASKVLSFLVLATGCSILIYFVSASVSVAGFILVIVAITFSTLLFTILGIGVAVIAPSLNHYFMYSIAFSILMVPTILEYFGLFSTLFVYLSPTTGILHLIHTAYRGGADWEIGLAIGSLLPWIAVSFMVVRKKLDQLVSMRIGEHSWIKL